MNCILDSKFRILKTRMHKAQPGTIKRELVSLQAFKNRIAYQWNVVFAFAIADTPVNCQAIVAETGLFGPHLTAPRHAATIGNISEKTGCQDK